MSFSGYLYCPKKKQEGRITIEEYRFIEEIKFGSQRQEEKGKDKSQESHCMRKHSLKKF